MEEYYKVSLIFDSFRVESMAEIVPFPRLSSIFLVLLFVIVVLPPSLVPPIPRVVPPAELERLAPVVSPATVRLSTLSFAPAIVRPAACPCHTIGVRSSCAIVANGLTFTSGVGTDAPHAREAEAATASPIPAPISRRQAHNQKLPKIVDCKGEARESAAGKCTGIVVRSTPEAH